MLRIQVLILSLICWILVCRVQSQDNDNIALFKGKSMFSFTCAETTPLKGNAYNFDLPSKTYKYIADANDILPNEAHRYSMNEHQAARTIIYTKSTDEYADNEYHDCIRELVFNTDYVKRSVFAVLDNYECSVNNKELKIIRGEDFQFSASLNFTHISPEFTCTTEGIGSSSIDLSIDYYDNSTERSLKGKITANVVLKDIGLNGLKASCAFKYDHLENFKTEEIEHIENLPAPEGMPVAVIYKQPKFFFNDDKEKVVCKISVSYEYGPDNVKADLHPILEDRVLCTYSAIFSTKNRTIWRINGNEVSGTDGDILNITSITRPADISCEPCVEYFNGEINCTISGIFQLLDNSTPPVIKPPSGRNFPSNIAVFDDQTKPFRFYCHAYPSSPLVIHSSSFGPNGNLIADQNSIVPGQNHRYRMETDEYFTRIIEYNASSIAAYDDNIYHDCTVRHNETHRAVVVVLSNMECPETFVKGVEDTQFNLTYKIDFTHIEPLVKCNANTLGTVKYDKKIISNDPTKPMKTTLIATLIFYFPRKFGTYANCSFVYDRSENMYLSEAIHIQGFEPADAYFDSQLPLWAYEEDKQRASCHTKMEIQYGPSDIKITANPLDPNILSCDYDARADRFLYANWHFNGFPKYNASLSSLDVSNEPSANIVCEPCIQFFNLEIRCKKSESYFWNSSVTTQSPQTTTATPTSTVSTTKAPTTTATPTSTVSTTKAPTTTATPTSTVSTTKAPTTTATPTSTVSTTKAPTTKAPTTKAPTTAASTTIAPSPTSDASKLNISTMLGLSFIIIHLFVYLRF